MELRPGFEEPKEPWWGQRANSRLNFRPPILVLQPELVLSAALRVSTLEDSLDKGPPNIATPGFPPTGLDWFVETLNPLAFVEASWGVLP